VRVPSLEPRPKLRECLAAGQVCDAYEHKEAERN